MVASTVTTHGESKREKVSVNSTLFFFSFLELLERGNEQRGREGFVPVWMEGVLCMVFFYLFYTLFPPVLAHLFEPIRIHYVLHWVYAYSTRLTN